MVMLPFSGKSLMSFILLLRSLPLLYGMTAMYWSPRVARPAPAFVGGGVSGFLFSISPPCFCICLNTLQYLKQTLTGGKTAGPVEELSMSRQTPLLQVAPSSCKRYSKKGDMNA